MDWLETVNMAHFDEILTDLTKVAREIGEFIALGFEGRGNASPPQDDGSEREASPLQLTETITVWELSLKALQALNQSRKISGDLVEWVEQQPFFHHQIRLRRETVSFARSYMEDRLPEKRDDAENIVFQISDDPSYALSLTKLFQKIDQNEFSDPFIQDNPLVRLLEVPSFQVYGLWLFSEPNSESRILIISAAERYRLTEGALLRSEEFFDALRTGGPMIDVI